MLMGDGCCSDQREISQGKISRFLFSLQIKGPSIERQTWKAPRNAISAKIRVQCHNNGSFDILSHRQSVTSSIYAFRFSRKHYHYYSALPIMSAEKAEKYEGTSCCLSSTRVFNANSCTSSSQGCGYGKSQTKRVMSETLADINSSPKTCKTKP